MSDVMICRVCLSTTADGGYSKRCFDGDHDLEVSEHTSILCRQDREIVQGIISGEIPLVDNNDDVIRRVVERMWAELEGWHRLAWLWADMKISEKPVENPLTRGGL